MGNGILFGSLKIYVLFRQSGFMNFFCYIPFSVLRANDSLVNLMFVVPYILVTYNNNSMASVRERTRPTERPPPVSEGSSANC
jgi:hypothetical protein